MTDRVGQHWGHYQLIQLLGRGHWASVYLGKHRHLHSQAALKVLHDPLAAGEVEGFLVEARTLARLRHPHIVRVLDFGMQEGAPFLVMEYAPGGTLRQHHPQGMQLPLQTVVSYVKQVAFALQYAHALRLIHRDLKPENLLLGPDQEILLSDFGLAIVAHSARSQPTQRAAGSLAYMAPEQLQGHPTAASDQYALGVLAYEWLCGSRPFEGSVTEVMVQQLRTPPPSLREQVPTLPVGVERVVLKALAKDPSQRFAAVHDFALALEEACLAETSSGQTLLMPSSHSPATSGQSTKHNLPAPLTSLIGREQEVTAACLLLRHPEIRLLTFVGTGGVGKTRLALKVAIDLLDDFPEGIYFVPLASISDPNLVIPAIAQVFGVKEIAGRSFLDQLKAFLQEKHLLLFLDNFEQILGAAPQLTALLASCPSLKILVTSRATLHVQGEQEFPVPPLALPDLTQLPPFDVLSHYAAVALFLQRAQAVKPALQITQANASAVAQICVRLDGLPLAIELAAARSKLFPPPALLARLGQRLAVLTGGARDAPARQQTLRDTLAWSYQLLEAQEQQLFRRLSVFVGSCTREAVEAVCATLGDQAGSVMEAVASLIDKSLLQPIEQEAEEARFLLLETIREYGLECLATSGETEATKQAHAVYYLALTEQAAEQWLRAEEQAWLAQLDREHDNLRAAMTWLLEHRTARESSEMALRLGAALWWFWVTRGYCNEGWNLLEQALEGSEGVAVPIHAQVLWATGNLAAFLGHVERGEVLCQQSLALFQEIGNSTGMRDALFHLGIVAHMRGDYAAARSRFEESLVLSRQAGDKADAAWALVSLEQLANIQGEHARVGPLAEESLALFREVGIRMGTDDALKDWAKAVFFQGDLARAQALAQECLALERQLGDKEGEAELLALLGEVALQQGDPPTARLLLEQSCAMLRQVSELRAGIDEEQQMAWTLSRLGKVLAIQGNYPAARALYEESLESLVPVQAGTSHRPFVDIYVNLDFALEGLAAVVAAQGELAWAAHLWGAAQARRDTRGTPRPPVYRADYDRSVTAARAQLGEKLFIAAWNEGRTMTPEQALAARGPLPMPTLIPAEPATVPPTPKAATYPDGLTAREVEVLRLVADGLTDHQIAEQLVISPRTVNTHVTSIYTKIRVSSRSAATRYAMEHTLI